MPRKLFRLLSVLILLVCSIGYARPALAVDEVCNWTAGSGIDYEWGNGGNWACSGGSGPPTAEKQAVISSGAANAPLVSGNAAAKSVTISSGYLKIGVGATLNVATTWTNLGNATIDSQGTLQGNGEVTASGGFHLLASGKIIGNLTIDALATAYIGAIYLHGNVVNSGTLADEYAGDGQFHMLGQTFANYGRVSVAEVMFESGNGAVQEVSGGGDWDTGTESLFVSNGTHLTAKSNVNFNTQHFVIGGNDDRLDIGSFVVTFKGPGELVDTGWIVGASGGSVHTQDDGLQIKVPNEGHFEVPLIVESGVTSASGVFSETLTVNQPGTLRVLTAPSGKITAGKNVIVNGVLDGEDDETLFDLRGLTMTVNGSVRVAALTLDGTSRQLITGTGSLDLHELNVLAPGGLTLGTPLRLDGALGLFDNVYASPRAVITLAESSTLLGDANMDIFGTVRRTGPFIQDKGYSFGNLALTVVFTDAGSAMPTGITLTTYPAPWTNLPGSIDRSYSIQTTGGNSWRANLRLDYRDSELHGVEEYLQAWRRSSAAAAWERMDCSEAHFGQNWMQFEGLTHFSDWGLSIQAVYLPVIRK